MKTFVTGGTGFIGTTLMRALSNRGHEVTTLTRSVRKGMLHPNGVSYIEGNPVKKGIWQERVSEHDAVMNLAGASIFSIYISHTGRSSCGYF